MALLEQDAGVRDEPSLRLCPCSGDDTGRCIARQEHILALFKLHTWDWYSNQAFRTVKACMGTGPNGNPSILYSRLGLMGETVFGEILKDLTRENLTDDARAFEDMMKIRARAWNNEAVPFGSEMSWDSTGQEGSTTGRSKMDSDARQESHLLTLH